MLYLNSIFITLEYLIIFFIALLIKSPTSRFFFKNFLDCEFVVLLYKSIPKSIPCILEERVYLEHACNPSRCGKRWKSKCSMLALAIMEFKDRL